MKLALAALAILTFAPAAALAAEPAVPTPIVATQTTVTGQPVALPQGPVQVTAFTLEIPADGRLPPHQHPYQRFAYVLSGRLQVTYVAAKLTKVLGPGDFLVEAVGQTHFGVALDGKPVKLLVVDQTPPGANNTVLVGPVVAPTAPR